MNREYMIVEDQVDADRLNRFGAEGWELVAVVSPARCVLHDFFKRRAASWPGRFVAGRRRRLAAMAGHG